jgi:hypothetical protein
MKKLKKFVHEYGKERMKMIDCFSDVDFFY